MNKAVLAFGLCMLTAAAQGHVLFYPTAARKGTNLAATAKWRPPTGPEMHCSVGKGGPFSVDGTVRRVETQRVQAGYWRAPVKVMPGRIYLHGTWARFGNARLLFWMHGQTAANRRPIQRRLYYTQGFNPMLRPYFSDETLKMIAGDPERWRLFYRTVRFPEPVRGGTMTLAHGLYCAAGDVTLAEPFFVDITDGPRTMDIDIADAKPFVRLTVTRADTRDVRWNRRFDPAATSFACTLPEEIDAFPAMDERLDKGYRPAVKGYILTVRYADGTVESVAAPHEDVKKEDI